jgi:hypothetical protein
MKPLERVKEKRTRALSESITWPGHSLIADPFLDLGSLKQ